MDDSSESQQNSKKIVTVDINTFIEKSKDVDKNVESIIEYFKTFLDANNFKDRDNYFEIAKDIEIICEDDEMKSTYKYLK